MTPEQKRDLQHQSIRTATIVTELRGLADAMGEALPFSVGVLDLLDERLNELRETINQIRTEFGPEDWQIVAERNRAQCVATSGSLQT